MEEKNQNLALCAITKEFAEGQLRAITGDPEKKKILDEYFLWVKVLNTPVDIVTEPKEDVTTSKDSPSKEKV